MHGQRNEDLETEKVSAIGKVNRIADNLIMQKVVVSSGSFSKQVTNLLTRRTH